MFCWLFPTRRKARKQDDEREQRAAASLRSELAGLEAEIRRLRELRGWAYFGMCYYIDDPACLKQLIQDRRAELAELEAAEQYWRNMRGGIHIPGIR